MQYLDVLIESAQKTGSIVSMGLDPVIDFLPDRKYLMHNQHHIIGNNGNNEDDADDTGPVIVTFFEMLFDKMAEREIYPGAFKPNLGFYHTLDRPMEGCFDGSLALADVLDLLEEYFPEIPVILDYKRGDIARSSQNYATEGFAGWEADAVTIAPYMGSDSILPFLQYTKEGKGVYILNRTSNTGAADFQSLMVEGEKPLYMEVGNRISRWAEEYPGTGAVVGATSTEELAHLARFFEPFEIPLLIPGVGGQGGSAAEVAQILRQVNYRMEYARVNSSSGITHPWGNKEAPKDWAEICVDRLEALNREIGFRERSWS